MTASALLGPVPPAESAVRRWWPWLPLLPVVVTALCFVWSHYFRLDPATATVKLPAALPWKYPLLIVHIGTGSIALLTLLAQALPAVRRSVRLHRRIGRVYVFAGVLPGATSAAVLLAVLSGPGWTGRALLEVGWAAFTVGGVVAAARGNLALHRRLMAYSAALTLDAFSVRFLEHVLGPLVGTTLTIDVFFYVIAWGGWVVNLLVAHIWVETTARRLRRRAALACA